MPRTRNRLGKRVNRRSPAWNFVRSAFRISKLPFDWIYDILFKKSDKAKIRSVHPQSMHSKIRTFKMFRRR